MNVKKIKKSIMIIWIVSLVACCVPDIFMVMLFGDVIAVSKPIESYAVSTMLPALVLPFVYGIPSGITLAKQPQGKRKILLFNILFAVSYFLCRVIIFTITSGIVNSKTLLLIFDSAMLDRSMLFLMSGVKAAFYAIAGIIVGLLSCVIANKVCKNNQ